MKSGRQKDTARPDPAEYVLIVGLMVLVAIAALTMFAGQVSDVLSVIAVTVNE